MSLDLDEIRERALPMRDGFYHAVGYYRALRREDFDALVAEVERLRAQRALDNDALARAWDEGRDMERASTVAWLREPGEYVDPACARLADCIERGVARRTGT